MTKLFKTLPITIYMVFMFVMPVFAEAAGGEGHAEAHAPGLKFLYTIVNFVFLLIALYYFLKKPAREYFETRSVKTKLDIEEAQKLHNEAYRCFEEIEAKLQNADVEGKKLIADIKEKTEIEKQRLIAHSREMAEKIKRDTQKIADQELIRVKQSLKAEAVRLATELAVQKIKQEITSEDQIRIGSKFVSQIQKVVL